MEVNKLSIKEINSTDELKDFINLCDEELISFRYFNKRPLDIYKNHFVANLVYFSEDPVAYYHLDKENRFGICVRKEYQGYGLASFILNHVVSFCRLNGIKEINLIVDIDNMIAINLYNKFGFKIIEVNNKYIIMLRENG